MKHLILIGSFLFQSPLPIITINTGGEYIPDEPKTEGEMGIIWRRAGLNVRNSEES